MIYLSLEIDPTGYPSCFPKVAFGLDVLPQLVRVFSSHSNRVMSRMGVVLLAILSTPWGYVGIWTNPHTKSASSPLRLYLFITLALANKRIRRGPLAAT